MQCGGPDGSSLTTNNATLVPATTAHNVAAIVFMGDPRHVGGESFNQGNATAGGVSVFPTYTHIHTQLSDSRAVANNQ